MIAEINSRNELVIEVKKDFLVTGPEISDEQNFKAFKKVHKDYFTKKGRVYSKEKTDFNLTEFIENWDKVNKRKIKEMYISDFKIVNI